MTKDKKARTLRKEQQTALRLKSRGFIPTTTDEVLNTKKTKFDEEEPEASSNEDEDSKQSRSSNESDDDDDDAVEEVTATAAKEQVEAQEAKEELAAQVASKQPARTRKKRAIVESDDEEEELDETFFAQLETEQIQQKQNAKKAKSKAKQAKHTVFHANSDTPQSTKVADGLHVQVISETSTKEQLLTERMRTIHEMVIPNGIVAPTENKKDTVASGWVRSDRMKRMSCGGRRRGRAAVKFCKR